MKRLPVAVPVPVADVFAAVALSALAGAQVALPGSLVSTEWLADNLSKVQVVEVRSDPRGVQAFLAWTTVANAASSHSVATSRAPR